MMILLLLEIDWTETVVLTACDYYITVRAVPLLLLPSRNLWFDGYENIEANGKNGDITDITCNLLLRRI